MSKDNSSNPVVNISTEQSLDVSESDENYINPDQCHCNSCNYISNWERKTSIFLIWGSLVPLLWLLNIMIMLYGLLWLNSTPIRFNEYIQMFNIKVGFTNVSQLIPNGNSIDYLDYHQKLRNKFHARIWYSVIAITIYVIFIVLIVYGAINHPHILF